MANYKINEKNKKIIVSALLSDIEKEIISLYISQGYTVKQKTKTKRILQEDIIKWFDKNQDNEGLKKFKSQKDKKIKDKNGNERKAGYLSAYQWFKTTYPEAIKEIKEEKNNR